MFVMIHRQDHPSEYGTWPSQQTKKLAPHQSFHTFQDLSQGEQRKPQTTTLMGISVQFQPSNALAHLSPYPKGRHRDSNDVRQE